MNPDKRSFLVTAGALGLTVSMPAIAQYTGSYAQFFRALDFDDERVVRTLLLKGFDPNTPTEEGMPAISYAMFKEAHNCVRTLLLSNQLDVNQADLRGDTPLMVASFLDNSGWVAALLGKGASLRKSGQWTALHYAATSGSVKAMDMLLSAGAEINALSANDTTPLMMAARENREDAVRYLLKAGANAELVNQSGFNAAGYAMKANNKNLASEIMQVERSQRRGRSNS